MKTYFQKVSSILILCTGLFLACPIFSMAQTTTANTASTEIIIPEPYENLSLYAQSAVLIDGDTNRILFGKNPLEHMPNASTTKILTCILAMELGTLDQVCDVSDYARSMPETKCGFYEGDQFYLKDLLYSLMLESHNDSAVVIAEAIGGSVEGFAALMNEKAKELGCISTYFITPNGLDAEDETGTHGSSAYDLALMMNYCRQNDLFLEITQTPSYSFSDIDGKHTYIVDNKNSFLSMQAGVLTGKTGFTSKAGYCYVCSYQENGRNYSLAILASGWPNHRTYRWADAKGLIAYGNKYYEKEMIGLEKTSFALEVPKGIVMDEYGFSYRQETVIENDGVQWEMLLGEKDAVTTYTEYEPIELPVMKDEKAGEISYYVNGKFAGTQELFYTETIYKQDFQWCFTYFLQEFLQIASFS